MKIEIDYERYKDSFIIRKTNIEYCCEKSSSAFDDSFLGVGECEYTHMDSKEDLTACIYRCNAYPESVSWDLMTIDFCPFCGEKIETTKNEVVK